MPLSYLRDDCHKPVVTHIRESRRFESMSTLQGKTRPTRHTPSMLDLHMVLDHTSHVLRERQPFTSPYEVEEAPTPRRSLEVGERSFGPVVTQLLQLTVSINTNMRSVHSILARGGQLIGP
jgi:hypothetical protein